MVPNWPISISPIGFVPRSSASRFDSGVSIDSRPRRFFPDLIRSGLSGTNGAGAGAVEVDATGSGFGST